MSRNVAQLGGVSVDWVGELLPTLRSGVVFHHQDYSGAVQNLWNGGSLEESMGEDER
jgi:hypothetical protein